MIKNLLRCLFCFVFGDVVDPAYSGEPVWAGTAQSGGPRALPLSDSTGLRSFNVSSSALNFSTK